MELLLFWTPGFRWLGENPLVQTNAHGILRVDSPIECSFEVSMRAKTLLDEATPSSSRPQLQGFEPLHIFSVEEHVSDRHQTFVNFVGMPGQYNPFDDHTAGIRRQTGASADEFEAVGACRILTRNIHCVTARAAFKEKSGYGTPGYWSDKSGDGGLSWVQVTVILVNVVRGLASL